MAPRLQQMHFNGISSLEPGRVSYSWVYCASHCSFYLLYFSDKVDEASSFMAIYCAYFTDFFSYEPVILFLPPLLLFFGGFGPRFWPVAEDWLYVAVFDALVFEALDFLLHLMFLPATPREVWEEFVWFEERAAPAEDLEPMFKWVCPGWSCCYCPLLY